MGQFSANSWWQTTPLAEMDRDQWEALCDGCGRCCLLKLEDVDQPKRAPERFLYTRVACQLLDCQTGRCSDYADRLKTVPDCVVLDLPTLMQQKHWMPETCAYRRLAENRPLPQWHPLITGDPETVRLAGISVADWVLPEGSVADEDLTDYLIAPFHHLAD